MKQVSVGVGSVRNVSGRTSLAGGYRSLPEAEEDGDGRVAQEDQETHDHQDGGEAHPPGDGGGALLGLGGRWPPARGGARGAPVRPRRAAACWRRATNGLRIAHVRPPAKTSR